MARFFKPITLDKLKPKVEAIFEKFREDYELPQQIGKDLSKVNFDWENYTDETETEGFAEYPVGYRELDNGLNFFFCNAGGDWEYPICFIFYWDGKQMRGYIPSDGNVWNRKYNSAYGSEEFETDDEDNEYDESELDKLISEEKMIADIKKRILLKV